MSPLVWGAVVLIGGAGSVLRFVVDRAIGSRSARSFPPGTLGVNLSGATALGLISGLALGPTAALLAGTAAVGAYTTFSTWMLESDQLAEERQIRAAAANIVLSIAFGVAAAAVGQVIGEHL
jgi:fluoride exporter